MKWIQIILADYIRRGKVTVDIPGLDTEELSKAMRGEADRLLRAVMAAAFNEALSDKEKVLAIQDLLL